MPRSGALMETLLLLREMASGAMRLLNPWYDWRIAVIEIDAPPEAVWAVLEPRARPHYFMLGVVGMRDLPSGPDAQPRLLLQMDDELHGEDCDFVADVQFHGPMDVELQFNERPVTSEDMTCFGCRYTVWEENGRCYAAFSEDSSCHNLPILLLTRWLDPAGDTLRSLKAICEGSTDLSSNGAVRHAKALGQDTDAAFASVPRFRAMMATGGLIGAAALLLVSTVTIGALITLLG